MQSGILKITNTPLVDETVTTVKFDGRHEHVYDSVTHQPSATRLTFQSVVLTTYRNARGVA